MIEFSLEQLLLRSGADLPPDQPGDEAFLTAYATLGWRLRKFALPVSPELFAGLTAAGLPGVDAWSVGDVGRVLALRRHLLRLGDHPATALVERIFRTGDNGEREAMLKGLMALPSPERFLATAADSCRAAVLTTFAAIACDNTYPARHFPDLAFRAMVVKALHLGLPLARIHGLAERRDAELARMAEDYASERRHAGRPVPDDVHLLTIAEGPLP